MRGVHLGVRREKWEQVVNVIMILLKVSVAGGVRTSVVRRRSRGWPAGLIPPLAAAPSLIQSRDAARGSEARQSVAWRPPQRSSPRYSYHPNDLRP